jgi:hypothetical protein
MGNNGFVETIDRTEGLKRVKVPRPVALPAPGLRGEQAG